jgi:hypothetical protein
MKSLALQPYTVTGSLWQSSDLANSNLLVSGNRPKVTETEVMKNKPLNLDETKINIYPNPVSENQFVVQFGQLAPGNYTIQVTDAMGRQVIQQAVSLSGDNQSQMIKMSSSSAKGVYLVKVLSAGSKAVFSTKLVVQ